jgi:hypothetical protein
LQYQMSEHVWQSWFQYQVVDSRERGKMACSCAFRLWARRAQRPSNAAVDAAPRRARRVAPACLLGHVQRGECLHRAGDLTCLSWRVGRAEEPQAPLCLPRGWSLLGLMHRHTRDMREFCQLAHLGRIRYGRPDRGWRLPCPAHSHACGGLVAFRTFSSSYLVLLYDTRP